MGRPSKLSPSQWADIAHKLDAGARVADLAAEYNVSVSQVYARVSRISRKKITETARKLVVIRKEVEALPPMEQRRVLNLADTMMRVSSNLAGAAELGSDTARRLHALANGEVGKITPANLGKSDGALKRVVMLARTANESGAIAMGLINAKRLKEQEETEPEVPSVIRLVGVRAEPEE